MRKILFVIPDLGAGGTNPSLEALYSHIRDKYEIKVFAIVHQSRSREYLFDNVLLPQDRSLSMLYTDYNKQKGLNKVCAFFYKSLDKLLHLFNIDLRCLAEKKTAQGIELNNVFDTIVAYQEGYTTSFVSFFRNPNKVAWVHCNYDKWMPQDRTELTLYDQFKHIVCVSDYTASVFAKRYPSLSNRVLGIHNFVESDQIKKMGGHKIDDKRFETDKFIILSVGRFHSVKRFSEIPKIAAAIKKCNLEFYWYILGDISESKEKVLFDENVKKNEVDDCVKWLGGKNNPYPYFKASDLYVCTSDSEACPMVFIESNLFGLPIVTTDFPSAYEFVVDSKNGRVMPIENISDAIRELLTDRAKYLRMKEEVSYFIYDNSSLLRKVESVL